MPENPYPGLRPFRRDEAHLFFGRDEQTDHLLDKLAETRFIAVTGLSGSGKSSLVQAGLLPNLEFGYLVEAGTDWSILTMRPGIAPIQNLAQAVLEANLTPGCPPKEREGSLPFSKEGKRGIDALTQRLSSGGHLEFTRLLQESLSPGQRRSFLLVVDQFEELFRYEKLSRLEECKFFVELLLTSAKQQDVSVYVILTIRSDWLGQCARFHGLPEAINAGQFLVPRLTQEQMRLAITAPAHVAEGTIDDRLVWQLLQDSELNSDQLPVVQHCLMRMWALKTGAISKTFPVCLTLDDYKDERVGGLINALSKHADEAYTNLDERQQWIAERMFRCLTEGELRRPAKIQDIAAVADASVVEVVVVANAFRQSDRCFLSPSGDTPLAPETVIDISHESLIRQWKRLSGWEDKTGWKEGWADQEKESAEMYKRLERTARLWEDGKAGLWSNPDLANALKWRSKEQPTSKWAARYEREDSAFELAMEFLKISVKAQERKRLQEKQARWRELRLRQTRRLLIWAVIGIIGTLGLSIWAVWERAKAETARKLAMEEGKKTEQALIKAQSARADAEKQKNIAVTEKENAEQARKEAEEQKVIAQEAKEEAELNKTSFQEMLTATFGFLTEEDRIRVFADWTQSASILNRLTPALELMINQSESMNPEMKEFFITHLATMDNENRVMLFYILGQEAAAKTKNQ